MTEKLPPARTCGRCKQVLPLDMFYIEHEERTRRAGRVRLQPCRLCVRDSNNAKKAEKQAYSDHRKLESGCVDCGTRKPYPEMYDFDHMPGTAKVRSIAACLTSGTLEQMIAEIAKCEVVCANCHRIRTRRRPHGGWQSDVRAGLAVASTVPTEVPDGLF